MESRHTDHGRVGWGQSWRKGNRDTSVTRVLRSEFLDLLWRPLQSKRCPLRVLRNPLLQEAREDRGISWARLPVELTAKALKKDLREDRVADASGG